VFLLSDDKSKASQSHHSAVPEKLPSVLTWQEGGWAQQLLRMWWQREKFLPGIESQSFSCTDWTIPISMNSIEQSPSWQAHSHLAKQDICLLWNLKVHFHVHKGLPLVPILSQMNPVHILPTYFPKTHYTTPRCSKSCLPFGFSNKNQLPLRWPNLSYA